MGTSLRNELPIPLSGSVDVEVLQAKLQLVVMELFGAPAELAALQLLNNEMEPFDLGLCLAKRGALDCERAHQLLQCSHIVRQGGEIDVHKGGV
jgi:hypothetical protein